MVFFDSTLVRDGVDADDAVGAIRGAAEEGVRAGLFTPDYVTAVCQREQSFPTGLGTSSSVGVAIPHATPTDPDQMPSLSVARLTRPVPFRAMGGTTETVDVGIVFLLSVPGRDNIELLSALVRIFQNEEAMARLPTASREELYSSIRRSLEDARIPVERLPGNGGAER